MAVLDVTDVELAHRLQTSRQTINSRRKGRVAMSADDPAEMADALGISPALLLGPPHEAVAWLAEHRSAELDDVLSKHSAANECTAPYLNRSLLGAKILVRVPPGGLRAAA